MSRYKCHILTRPDKSVLLCMVCDDYKEAIPAFEASGYTPVNSLCNLHQRSETAYNKAASQNQTQNIPETHRQATQSDVDIINDWIKKNKTK